MKTKILSLLFIMTITLTSCVNLKKENSFLKQQLDSIKKENDSIRLLIPLENDGSDSIQQIDKENGYLKSLLENSDTLTMTHRNDDCGEWGGDKETIKIFSNYNYKKKLYVFYIKEDIDCHKITSKPKIYKSVPKELTNNDALVVQLCISDLLMHRLRNNNEMGNSGISNSVVLKRVFPFTKPPLTKTIICINDYPSFNWNRFEKLKKSILEQNANN